MILFFHHRLTGLPRARYFCPAPPMTKRAAGLSDQTWSALLIAVGGAAFMPHGTPATAFR